jgi:hypothetical protein
MWQLVVLVLTWRSAVLALQLGLDDVKAIADCPDGMDTCNGGNISHSTNEYVSGLVLLVECSSVTVKICSTELWRYKEIFHCECSSQSNFLLTFKAYRLLYVLAGLTLKVPHADYKEFICFICISKQTVTFALYIINGLFYITELESVYCAVRIDPFCNTDTFRL